MTASGRIYKSVPGGLAYCAALPEKPYAVTSGDEVRVGAKWIVFTSASAYMFDTRTNTVAVAPEHFVIPGGTVREDPSGNYWVYNKTGFLYYIDSGTGRVRPLQLVDSETAHYVNQETFRMSFSGTTAWIATYGAGLYSYDTVTGSLHNYRADNSPFPRVAGNYLQDVLVDRGGGVWTSADFMGVSHFSTRTHDVSRLRFPSSQPFSDPGSDNVRMVSTTSDGRVWFGTIAGDLYSYDAALRNRLSAERYDKSVYAVHTSADGTLWVGTRYGGLYVGGRHYLSGDSASIANNSIYSFLRDSSGRTWVGTFGGLSLAVPDGHGGYRFRNFMGKGYTERNIRTLAEDRNGYVWAGTSNGVCVFRPDSLMAGGGWHSYNTAAGALRGNEVRQIFVDSRGRVWIAETGSGFCVCTPGNDYSRLVFTHYGTEDGLAGNMVQAFAEDSSGNLWIATEYGLSRFNPSAGTFSNFFFSGDERHNVYNENAAVRLADGRLAFGTLLGAAVIDPLRLRNASGAPDVYITGFRLNGISSDGTASDDTLALPYARSVTLCHDENSFVVSFSTLDYSVPARPRYSYRLDGYDSDWSPLSQLNLAAYKNLPPGTYILRVRACDAEGQWSRSEASLGIVVRPPFWLTWWAWCVYGVLLCAAAWAAFAVVRKMNRLRNRIKVEKQLTEYKLVFFTNITHEFRTPLTLIRAAVERLSRNAGKADADSAVRLLDRSSGRMLRLVNQLLEFRKMENRKLALSLEQTDVIAFVFEIYLCFKDTAAARRMAFSFVPFCPAHIMFIDKDKVDKIVYNLLSNAFKYTPEGGSVALAVSLDAAEGMLRISVTDTGVGIPPERRKELFSRFMQTNLAADSMGIGLYLVHGLAAVHHGSVGYAENPSGGSVFTVSIPAGAGVYSPNDFLCTDTVLMNDEESHRERILRSTADGDAVTEVCAPPDVPVVPSGRRRVLVIEDDDEVRRLLADELGACFDVTARADGMSGLAAAASDDEWDLIVCDVLMPGLSGFEVTCRLKDDFKTSHIPVVMLTALDDEASYLRGVECGADAYITKPFSISLLLTRVCKLIEQRDRLREKFSTDLSVSRPVVCATDGDRLFADRLASIVQANLNNSDFSLDDFAAEMSLGRTTFCKKVRGVTGYSPKEYLRVMRMRRAAELLRDGGRTVSEVAYAIGMSDPYYFSKCFKSQFGVAPSEWQKGK